MIDRTVFMLVLVAGVLTVYCCMRFFHRIWNRMEEDVHVKAESDEQKEK